MFESRRRTQPTGWKRVLANQAKEFCLSTGLHGYKYIAQSHRSGLERGIWAVGVLFSLCCAIALMQIAWEYNASHPTLTVIESTHHGIWNYPFPAVTVCDLNRVSLNRTRELVSILKKPENSSSSDDSIIEDMRLLNELLDPGIFGRDVSANLSDLQDLFEYNNLSIPEVMKILTRNCTEMMSRCKWKGDIKPCDSLFEQTLSRDGLCCSFNYMGVLKTDTRKREPKRVTACGYQTGLTAMINPEIGDYHASLLGGYGVKVMLHEPFNYPDRNARNKLIGIGNEVFISVTPEVTYSTDDVRTLPVSKRNCVFANERKHIRGSAKQYSYHNCLADCRMKTIFKKCGCAPYYHNDLRNSSANATRICDLRDLECQYSNRNFFETSWPGENVTSGNLPFRIKNIESFERPCDCIPDCDLLDYPLESSTGVFDRNNSYQDLDFYKDVAFKDQSVMHIFFSDLVSTQYRRDVYYNWHNLFASFGGLLGLFAGFSLMSGFELIYFFSIRLIADLWMRRKNGKL